MIRFILIFIIAGLTYSQQVVAPNINIATKPAQVHMEEYQTVVVARDDLSAGTVLEASMLIETLWDVADTPSDSFPSGELLVGVVLDQDVAKWSPIMWDQIAFSNANQNETIAYVTLSSELVDLTFETLMKPGQQIDVLVSYPETEQPTRTHIENGTLLWSRWILRSGTCQATTSNNFSISLEMPPEEVCSLAVSVSDDEAHLISDLQDSESRYAPTVIFKSD